MENKEMNVFQVKIVMKSGVVHDFEIEGEDAVELTSAIVSRSWVQFGDPANAVILNRNSIESINVNKQSIDV